MFVLSCVYTGVILVKQCLYVLYSTLHCCTCDVIASRVNKLSESVSSVCVLHLTSKNKMERLGLVLMTSQAQGPPKSLLGCVAMAIYIFHSGLPFMALVLA